MRGRIKKDSNTYIPVLRKSMHPLSKDHRNKLFPLLSSLFEICFDNIEKVEAMNINPIEHHLTVLQHMMEIAISENYTTVEIKRAAALSLLHDISAVEKITKERVNEAYERSQAEGDELELRRQQNRILHMREGSAIAHKQLLELNKELKRVVFDAKDVEIICEGVRIHDNPSIDIPIPKSNRMMVAFREADRLWMLSPLGIKADLQRNHIKNPNAKQRQKQINHNYSRFKDERNLYEPGDGPFIDSETFIRTKKGGEICKRYHE